MFGMMQTTVVIQFFVFHLIFFGSGYGETICKWSNRLIPSEATGELKITVPLSYSYKNGYINDEPFWTYYGSKGWCALKQYYFGCTYGEQKGLPTTDLSLPNVESISYVMLKDTYPITLHKPKDETVPSFYVTATDKLDICAEFTDVTLTWTFKTKEEEDLKDISCYQNTEKFCSGTRAPGTEDTSKCAIRNVGGMIQVVNRFKKPSSRFEFYYCFLDKEMIKAQTFIVDWINGLQTRNITTTKELKVTEVAATTTSGAKTILAAMWPIGLLLILAKQL